jgi:hypothetical protein
MRKADVGTEIAQRKIPIIDCISVLRGSEPLFRVEKVQHLTIHQLHVGLTCYS